MADKKKEKDNKPRGVIPQNTVTAPSNVNPWRPVAKLGVIKNDAPPAVSVPPVIQRRPTLFDPGATPPNAVEKVRLGVVPAPGLAQDPAPLLTPPPAPAPGPVPGGLLKISRLGGDGPVKPKLSILICTLTSRAELLGSLLGKLRRQIDALPTKDVEVEVIVFEDQKEHPVGQKRNRLLEEARGDYVCFVDDDDDVSDDYVWQLATVIHKNPGVDCVGFRGLMSVAGQGSHQVHYSLQNDGQIESGGTYYRLPGHLTPIKKTLLGEHGIRFPEQNFGEDADFSAQLARRKCLKSEAFVDKVLYHYQFNPHQSETHPGRGPGAVMGMDRSVFHVVILSQQADNLRGCLDSILKNEPTLPRNRIVVVDDGLDPECVKEYPEITWIQGQKPFIFARNANLGIKQCPNDVILMNDDARLETRYGFSSLGFATRANEYIGITSAAVRGFVGNPAQAPWSPAAGMRKEPRNVAFVCVYIPRDTINKVGLLDERFVGYGMDDSDMCHRVKLADLFLMIYDGCVVEHNSTENKSTYRVKDNISYIYEQNKKLFQEKWPDLKLGPHPGA